MGKTILSLFLNVMHKKHSYFLCIQYTFLTFFLIYYKTVTITFLVKMHIVSKYSAYLRFKC